MLAKRFLAGNVIYVSAAHDSEDIGLTFEAAHDVLGTIKFCRGRHIKTS